MSYLKKHQDQKQIHSATKENHSITNSSPKRKLSKTPSSKKDKELKNSEETDDDTTDQAVEGKFKGLKLNNYSMHSVISSLTERVQAVDLSYNRIEDLPRGLPRSILGLNISHNKIQHLHVSKDLNHLIELNLSHNHLTKVTSLSVLTNIQFLNLSHNVLTIIEGLENMKSLKFLNLSNNLIQDVKHLRTLSFNSHLEEIDLLNNPITENLELKFLITNLIPSIKFINQAPLKVDPNKYGYLQTLPNQLAHVHQQLHPSHDSHDTASEATYPQRPFYRISSPIEEEEDSSWNQGLPAEHLQQVMQGRRQQLQHQQKQQPQMSQFNLPPPAQSSSNGYQNLSSHNIDIMALPEQLDSPPLSLQPQSNTFNQQKQNINGSSSTTQTRKSRLPWRNPPNPLPRNWDQVNQSVLGSSTKKKNPAKDANNQITQFQSQSFDFSKIGSVNLSGEFNTSVEKTVPRLRSEYHQQQQFYVDHTPSVDTDILGYSSQNPHIHAQRDQLIPNLFETSYMAPPPPPLPSEAKAHGAAARSDNSFTQPRNAVFPPRSLQIDESSSSSIQPPLESTRSSRWLSPQLSRRHRSKSPEEAIKSYIALPFPDTKNPSLLSTNRHSLSPQRASRVTSSPPNQPRYEKNPSTQSNYQLSQSNLKKLEKQDQLPAFISMTEKQKELLEQIRSSQEKEKKEDQQSVSGVSTRSRRVSPFERLSKQTIGHVKSSSVAKTGTYVEKFQLKTGTVLTKTARSKNAPASSANASTAAALLPLDSKIIEKYEKIHSPKKSIASPTKTKAKETEREADLEEQSPPPSSLYENASPYNRFLRLKKRINLKYDRELKSICEQYHLSEEEVHHFMKELENSQNNPHKSFYEYLPTFEKEVEEAMRNKDEDGSRTSERSRRSRSPSRNSQSELNYSVSSRQASNGHTPSVTSYNSTMLSLDSLQGNAILYASARKPTSAGSLSHTATASQTSSHLLSSLTGKRPSQPLQTLPTPLTSLEQEAFRLSQEIESLKIKKLQELSTNSTYLSSNQSLTSFDSYPLSAAPPIGAAQLNQQVYDHRLHSTQEYSEKHNPMKVLQQNSQHQHKSLEYHLEMIEQMLHKSSPNKANTATVNPPNPSSLLNERTDPQNGGKVMFPSFALYDETSPPNQQVPRTSATFASSIAPPSELPKLEEIQRTVEAHEKNGNGNGIIDFINRSFDHLNAENLNFQEMQAAIDQLKQHQLQSLQQLQSQ